MQEQSQQEEEKISKDASRAWKHPKMKNPCLPFFFFLPYFFSPEKLMDCCSIALEAFKNLCSRPLWK